MTQNTVTEMIARATQSGSSPPMTASVEVKSESYSLDASKTQSNGIDAEQLTSLSLIAIYRLAFAHLSKAIELAKHLASLQSKGVISDSETEEILLQYSILELRRYETEEHIGEVVVVYDRELFFGADLDQALEQVKRKHGSLQKKYYSETIGVTDYPSLME